MKKSTLLLTGFLLFSGTTVAQSTDTKDADKSKTAVKGVEKAVRYHVSSLTRADMAIVKDEFQKAKILQLADRPLQYRCSL